MIKKTICILVPLLLMGCGEAPQSRVITKYTELCESDTVKERKEFILSCISSANPKSDEEPEDWIRLCQRMAEETICETQPVLVTETCIYSSFGTCDRWRESNRAKIK